MKNKGNNKVLGALEEVYSGIWYMEKEGRLGKCQRSSSRFQRKNKYRSQKTEKVVDSRRTRFQMKEVTEKAYSKNVV